MKRLSLVATALLVSSPAFAEAPKGKGDAKKPAAETKTPEKPADAKPAEPAAPPLRGKADLKGLDGKSIGTAQLEESPHGVLVTLDLTNAPSGMHAFHIHETGKCEPPFKTAGGHFNPAGHEHGFKNPNGRHAGDLPNINVEGGKGTYQFFADGVTLKAGEKNSLLDADGSALVMHAKTDDYIEPKTGNAGDRIACGVIEKAGETAAPPTTKPDAKPAK
jgi:Cu-Zn family superoxide dismutase